MPQITRKQAQEVAQVANATFNIGVRIEGILDTIARRGVWHELHKPLGPGPRHGMRIKVGFHRNNRPHQVWINTVLLRQTMNQREDRCLRCQPRGESAGRVTTVGTEAGGRGRLVK